MFRFDFFFFSINQYLVDATYGFLYCDKIFVRQPFVFLGTVLSYVSVLVIRSGLGSFLWKSNLESLKTMDLFLSDCKEASL